MRLIIFCISFCLSTTLLGQEGYKVIHKAEKQIEKGNYEKALKLLAQADTMNYGFCGNAKVEARNSITLNRIKILDAKGESLEAANLLNETNIYVYKVDLDSLKMVYFIKSIDKAVIKKEIDSCINLISSLESIQHWMDLKLNVKFSKQAFIISNETVKKAIVEAYSNRGTNSDDVILEKFKASIRRQAFYLLLEN